MAVTRNEKGFGSVEFVVIIVVIVLLGTVGWLFYKSRPVSTATKAPSKPNTATASVSSTVSGGKYAGWAFATLTHEKLIFDYPKNWKYTNFNASSGVDDGSDSVEVTSPSGVEVNISTDNFEHPSFDGPQSIVFADQTTYLGQTAYVVYNTAGTSSSGAISSGSLSYSKSDFPSYNANPLSSPDYLKTRNMNPQGWLLIDVFPPQSKSNIYKSDIMSNQDYTTAKLIIQSMHY